MPIYFGFDLLNESILGNRAWRDKGCVVTVENNQACVAVTFDECEPLICGNPDHISDFQAHAGCSLSCSERGQRVNEAREEQKDGAEYQRDIADCRECRIIWLGCFFSAHGPIEGFVDDSLFGDNQIFSLWLSDDRCCDARVLLFIRKIFERIAFQSIVCILLQRLWDACESVGAGVVFKFGIGAWFSRERFIFGQDRVCWGSELDAL